MSSSLIPEPLSSGPSIEVPGLAPSLNLALASFLGPPGRPGEIGRIGSYHLLRLIGLGGMGMVFLARPAETPAQLVAVKLLKPELNQNPRAVAYFAKEARHLKRLDHPNLARILAIGESNSAHFFVMPHYAGGSLAQEIARSGALPVSRVVPLALAVADALAYAHRKGIVHRDLKPGNILLEADGQPCLADFGLSRSYFNDSLIDPRQDPLEGTPTYQSPASVAGEVEDSRGDIYSFGAVLYELLSGHPPYAGRTSQEVRERILAGPPAALQPGSDPRSRGLILVSQHCMARSLSDRYPSMTEVREDLERLQAGIDPLPWTPRVVDVAPRVAASHPSTVPVRFWKPPFRRNLVVGAAVVLAVLLSRWALPDHVPASATSAGGVSARRTLTSVPFGIEQVREFQIPEGEVHYPLLKPLRATDGLVLLDHQNGLLRVDETGGVSFPFKLPSSPGSIHRLDGIGDYLGHGDTHVLVTWNQFDSSPNGSYAGQLHASLFGLDGTEARRFSMPGPVRDQLPSDGESKLNRFEPLLLKDVDGDGRIEVVAAFNTGFDRQPRGVACFDRDTARLKWTYGTSGFVTGVQILDLDGHGQQAIVFVSSAVDNGARGPDGTDDTRSYVHALRPDGTLLWRVVLSHQVLSYTSLLAPGRTGIGSLEIRVTVTADPYFAAERGLPELAEVWGVTAQGVSTLKHKWPGQLAVGWSGTPPGQAVPLYFLPNQKGQVYRLDANLALLAAANLWAEPGFDSQIIFMDVTRLPDGRPVWLCAHSLLRQKVKSMGMNPSGPSDSIWKGAGIAVLDQNLTPMAELGWINSTRGISGRAFFLPRSDPKAMPEILMENGSIQIYRLLPAPASR